MKLKYSIWFNITIMMAIASLIFFSPIDSDNRRLDNNEKKKHKKETAIVSILFVGIYIGLLLFEQERYALCIGMGIILTAALQVPCIFRSAKKDTKMSFHDKYVEKQDD